MVDPRARRLKRGVTKNANNLLTNNPILDSRNCKTNLKSSLFYWLHSTSKNLQCQKKRRQYLTLSAHLKIDQTIVLKESSNAQLLQTSSYCFVFSFIKVSSLMTERSFCFYTDFRKSSNFVWSVPLAGFLIYMLSSLSCSLPGFINSQCGSLTCD